MKRFLVGVAVAAMVLSLSAPAAFAKGRKGGRGGCGGCDSGCAPACEYKEETRTVLRCVPVWEEKEIKVNVCVPKFSTETRKCTVHECSYEDRKVERTVCVPKTRTVERTVTVCEPSTEEREVVCYKTVAADCGGCDSGCGDSGGCGKKGRKGRHACGSSCGGCTQTVAVKQKVKVCVMKPVQKTVKVQECYYETKKETVNCKVAVLKPVEREYKVQVCKMETREETRKVKVCSYKTVKEDIKVRVPVATCGSCCN